MRNPSVACLVAFLCVGLCHGSGTIDSSSRQMLRGKEEQDRHLQSSASLTLTESADPHDLGIRFNKFNYQGATLTQVAPLSLFDYPLRGDTAIRLKNHSDAISVICEGDPALMPNHRALILRYIFAIGGLPSMPSKNTGAEFWDEFRELLVLQHGRRHNVDPGTVLRAPDLWSHRDDIHKVSDAVHNEYPGSLQVELIQWLWSQGVQLDYDIIPFRSISDFVGLQVAMADLNTWAIAEVAPMNFYIKWYAGRPRPEEVAFQIATGELTEEDGVPHDVVQRVSAMNLESPEEFTAYPEGSPRHPAWPAMHSAASSASFWLAVVLDLTEEQYCEALRVDYAVAFARSCAGVHYASDNTAGLNLGQTLIAERLPQHLANKYGSDPIKVQAKINQLRFDWRNFNSFDCTTGGS